MQSIKPIIVIFCIHLDIKNMINHNKIVINHGNDEIIADLKTIWCQWKDVLNEMMQAFVEKSIHVFKHNEEMWWCSKTLVLPDCNNFKLSSTGFHIPRLVKNLYRHNKAQNRMRTWFPCQSCRLNQQFNKKEHRDLWPSKLLYLK